jgi:hypothetical protein
METHIHFHQDGVRVTNTGLTVNGQTYDLNKITSVHVKGIRPKRWSAMLCIALGLVLLIDESGLFVIGGILITLGIVTGFLASQTYAVVLTMEDGEKEVLLSLDSVYIQKVVHALDTAMVALV